MRNNNLQYLDSDYYMCILRTIIAVPKQNPKNLLKWYHDVLCHPDEIRTKLIIGQQFYIKVSKVGVSPRLIKYFANYSVTADDVYMSI